MTFATEVRDVSRFESPRQLMSYLGLVPSERSTGGPARRGGITKAGNGQFAICWSKAPGLSTPDVDRQDKAIPARAGLASSARDCLEGAEPLDCPLPEAGCARQTNDGGPRCYRL